MANRAVNLFTEDRVQRGADGERQIITIAKVSERHAHQGVHRPARQAVVEQCPDHRLARGLHRLPRPFRRLHILRDRFGHGEEHQVNADAGGKQHRGPAQQAEFGLGLLRPELHGTKARAGNADHEDDIERRGQQIVPAEGLRHPVQGAPNPLGRKITKEDGRQGKQQNQPGGRIKNDRVDFVFFSVL